MVRIAGEMGMSEALPSEVTDYLAGMLECIATYPAIYGGQMVLDGAKRLMAARYYRTLGEFDAALQTYRHQNPGVPRLRLLAVDPNFFATKDYEFCNWNDFYRWQPDPSQPEQALWIGVQQPDATAARLLGFFGQTADENAALLYGYTCDQPQTLANTEHRVLEAPLAPLDQAA